MRPTLRGVKSGEEKGTRCRSRLRLVARFDIKKAPALSRVVRFIGQPGLDVGKIPDKHRVAKQLPFLSTRSGHCMSAAVPGRSARPEPCAERAPRRLPRVQDQKRAFRPSVALHRPSRPRRALLAAAPTSSHRLVIERATARRRLGPRPRPSRWHSRQASRDALPASRPPLAAPPRPLVSLRHPKTKKIGQNGQGAFLFAVRSVAVLAGECDA